MPSETNTKDQKEANTPKTRLPVIDCMPAMVDIIQTLTPQTDD